MKTQLRLAQSTQAVEIKRSLIVGTLNEGTEILVWLSIKDIAFYLSNLFCEQGTDKDNDHDLNVGRNFVLTNKNNVAEEGQEQHVNKLQQNAKTQVTSVLVLFKNH